VLNTSKACKIHDLRPITVCAQKRCTLQLSRNTNKAKFGKVLSAVFIVHIQNITSCIHCLARNLQGQYYIECQINRKQKRTARSADKMHKIWQSQPDDKRRRKLGQGLSNVESLLSNLIENDVDVNNLDEIIDYI